MNFSLNNRDDDKRGVNKLPIYFLIIFTILFIFFIVLALTSKNKSNNTLPSNPLKKVESITIDNDDEEEIEEYEGLDDDIIGNRPIAVMIDNNIGDGKHAGLQESYLNYEIIVEGGITRFMALYDTSDEVLIGPIRSSRHYFLDYAKENDAIYAHFGNSPYAETDVTELKVDNINGITDKDPYRRDDSLPHPHNVFTKLSYLRNYSRTLGYSNKSTDSELLIYSPSEYNLNEKYFSSIDRYVNKANNVSIYYSGVQTTEYKYDSENKYYLRYMNGKEHVDKVSNTQLHYKNIIIEYVENETIDEAGRQKLNNIGSGDGYYITNGLYIPIKWEKKSRTEKTKYIDKKNNNIEINSGNTFIQIVPINGNITIE